MPNTLPIQKHRATFRLSGNLKNVPTLETQTLEDLCINTIRILSADSVQNANSGHPGLPMGAAAMAYTLWHSFLKHNPKDPKWVDRDRFVLSAGHGSMLLYAVLHFWEAFAPAAETLAVHDLARQLGSPGRLFKIDESSLVERLEGIEAATDGRLSYGETAGLRQLYRHEPITPAAALAEAYAVGGTRR